MPTLRFVLACLLSSALSAQGPTPKTEAELDQQVTGILIGYARSAETSKLPSMARDAYRLIVAHYDRDHAAARAALGQEQLDGEWRQATPRERLPADTGTPAQRKSTQTAWRRVQKRLGKLHKDLGLALRNGGFEARAQFQLRRALAFVPDDVAVHDALGHETFEGFRGSAEQIAFVKRMREIRAEADAIAAMEFEVEQLDASQLPKELAATGISFAGARSQHSTWWVAGEFAEARDCALWSERGLRLLQWLFGEDPDVRKRLKDQPSRWVVVLRSRDQRNVLLTNSPSTRDGDTLERAQLFGGHGFPSGGGRAEWSWHDRSEDADHAVAHVTKRGAPWFNHPLGEGLVHTMTWLLCGSLHTSYMELAATEGEKEERSRDPAQCLAALRAAIENGEEWPLAWIPRERSDNFRNPARYKSWSFVTWLLARHPDEWVWVLADLQEQTLSEDDVRETVAALLHRDFDEIEAEWREWARAGSTIGKASGLPQ